MQFLELFLEFTTCNQIVSRVQVVHWCHTHAAAGGLPYRVMTLRLLTDRVVDTTVSVGVLHVNGPSEWARFSCSSVDVTTESTKVVSAPGYDCNKVASCKGFRAAHVTVHRFGI
jgi:hypothetical protein